MTGPITPSTIAARGWLLLLAVLALLAPLPAAAQDERVTVRVDGVAVLRVGPLGDVDAATRARRIEGRIAALLDSGAPIPPAVIEPPVGAGDEDTERVITVGGVPIVTVTQADAEDALLPSTAELALQWTQAIDNALQQAAARRTTAWGRFVAEVRGSVANAFGNIGESLITIVPRALASLLVIALFWLAATVVRWATTHTLCRLSTEPTLQNLIKQIAYYSVWVLGIIVAIDALGFDPQAVATGLGLTGLALGFALRDILSNFVGGLLILVMRPFKIGDQIIVGETEGSVERIELRATQILTYDGRRVLVPNADVFTSRVTNNTASPMRRAEVRLFLGYDVDLERAIEVIRSATKGTASVMVERPIVVLVRETGPDDIAIDVRFWTDSRRADFVATMSAVRRAIVTALKDAGIDLPDPHVRRVESQRDTESRAALSREAEPYR
jgi:small conductance mechanosensitive channel